MAPQPSHLRTGTIYTLLANDHPSTTRSILNKNGASKFRLGRHFRILSDPRMNSVNYKCVSVATSNARSRGAKLKTLAQLGSSHRSSPTNQQQSPLQFSEGQQIKTPSGDTSLFSGAPQNATQPTRCARCASVRATAQTLAVSVSDSPGNRSRRLLLISSFCRRLFKQGQGASSSGSWRTSSGTTGSSSTHQCIHELDLQGHMI